MRASRAQIRSALVVLGLTIAACPSPPAPTDPVVFDLIAELSRATVLADTHRIDFTAPAVTDHLVSGWALPEPLGTWSVSNEASLRFTIAWPRDLVVQGLCTPLVRAEGPPQTVRPSLNGHPLTEVTLKPGPHPYVWQLPAELLRQGENELRFEYAFVDWPREGPEADRRLRRLSVYWHSLTFVGTHEAPRPWVAREDAGPALFVPTSTVIDYYLRLPPDSLLAIDEVSADELGPGGDPRLRIALENEAGDVLWAGEVPHAGRFARRVSSASDPHQIVRLRLSADAPTGVTSGIWVRAPVLRSRFPLAPLGAPQRRAEAAGTSARAVASPPEPKASASPPRRPNILIYLVDTLRADHLSAYGYAAGDTPTIDALAAESVRFTHFTAQSSWTRTSVASLFTGLYPWSHRANRRDQSLHAAASTLAEGLFAAGYETAGFFANDTILEQFGFGQGFVTYEPIRPKSAAHGLYAEGAKLTAAANGWLRQRRADRPFFLYLHAMDPHAPYFPPPPFATRDAAAYVADWQALQATVVPGRPPPPGLRERVIAAYDAEIAYADRQLGAVLAELRANGLYDDTVIIFLSDHGEEFFDHGWVLHGKTLYRESLAVPFMIKLPRGRGGPAKSDEPAELVDVMPTLFELVGLTCDDCAGRSLLDAAGRVRPAPPGRPRLSLIDIDKRYAESVTVGPFKLISTEAYAPAAGAPPALQLFDLSVDPLEAHDLSATRPFHSRYLVTQLRSATGAGERLPVMTIELDGETEAMLKALGYVSDRE